MDFDFFPTEYEQQYNNALLNPHTPGTIPARWYEGVGSGLASGAETSYKRQLYTARKADKDEAGAQQAITEIEQLKPNPQTVGVVGQLMYNMADTLGTIYGEAMGGNITPQLMAIESGKTYAATQEQLHLREGVDPTTARSMSAIEGAGVGLGVVVPGNVAGGLVTRAATGAGINFVMGAGQRALIQNELIKGGYKEMAKQYEPFDGVQSATDIAIGAFFGGLLGERVHPAAQPARRLMPSEIDTVLTQNNAAHVELGTAPGVPTDLATRQAHVDMVSQAIKDLQEGNPVQATPEVTAGNFMENPGAVATRNEIGEAVRSHLSDLDQLQIKLEERGLPGDPNLYSVQPLDMPPVRVTSDVRGLIERATRDNLSTEQIIGELEGMLGKLEVRNDARRSVKDKVRGTLWIQERLTRAERLGELSPEQVGLAKWLLEKNPAIGEDLAISLRTSKQDGVGGMYNPIGRLAVLFKNSGDELTAAHEILHHTERMMPADIQQEIRKAWLAEVKRVRDAAERSGNENLALFINDVIKANLGMQANSENALNAIKQGLVNKDAYALFNPSEFWAVKASQIVAERAGEAWVQRAVQWVKELIEKAKELFKIGGDASVIRGLDAVLKSEGYQTAANLTDNYLPKFQFVGQKAETADTFSLQKAKQMLADKRSAELVRRETGWFMGTDGKWRFEIPDDEAKFNDSAVVKPADIMDDVRANATLGMDDDSKVPASIKSRPDYRQLHTATYKQGTDEQLKAFGHGDEEALKNLADHLARRRSKGAFEIEKVKAGEAFDLSTVLDHPKLYAAYPDLAKVRVDFVDGGDFRGSYNPRTDEITIRRTDDSERMLSTLLHEVQHAIQHREGFANGGSPDALFSDLVKAALDDLSNESKKAVQEWKWANSDKLAAAEKASAVSRYALMYESAQRLIDYANKDKPSGVFRLMRNELQWIYGKDFNENEAARNLQRDFYAIPKSHKMKERNAFLSDMSFRGAQLLLNEIPEQLRTDFKNDARTMKGMLNAFRREADRRSKDLSPLRDLESEARAAEDVQQAHRFSSPFSIYEALAGEVEARNTQTRQKMTAEERMYAPPASTADVPANKTIVMFGGLDIQAPMSSIAREDLQPAETGKRVSPEEQQARSHLDALMRQRDSLGEVAGLDKKAKIAAKDLDNQIIGLQQSISEIQSRDAEALTNPQATKLDPYSAEALVQQAPDLTIPAEDGTLIPATEALAKADAEIAKAQQDSQGFGAAVACALRG